MNMGATWSPTSDTPGPHNSSPIDSPTERKSMRKRTAEPLSELMANSDPPCVSIYQPTHWNHPKDRQDPIRFRNLLREVEVSLRRVYPSRGIRPLLERLQELTDSSRFSVRRHEGMAVFVSPSSFR